MIETTRGHFWIKFENGYKISVLNDYGSYSDNHFNMELRETYLNDKNTIVTSSNCEIAIIYHDELVNPFNWEDDVKRYITPNELLDIMNRVSKLKGDDE